MRRLISTFVVCIWQKQVFSWFGSFHGEYLCNIASLALPSTGVGVAEGGENLKSCPSHHSHFPLYMYFPMGGAGGSDYKWLLQYFHSTDSFYETRDNLYTFIHSNFHIMKWQQLMCTNMPFYQNSWTLMTKALNHMLLNCHYAEDF